MNLSELTNRVNELVNQKGSWAEISSLLSICQKNKLYYPKFEKFTHWVESLEIAKSTAICIKSAGEYWLTIQGKVNPEHIARCPIKDKSILTKLKSLESKGTQSHQKMKALKEKVISGDVTRAELSALLEPTGNDKVKIQIRDLKKEIKDNPEALALLSKLQEMVLA
jgi:hypothetical protein